MKYICSQYHVVYNTEASINVSSLLGLLPYTVS